jgi:hypothetical protein
VGGQERIKEFRLEIQACLPLESKTLAAEGNTSVCFLRLSRRGD